MEKNSSNSLYGRNRYETDTIDQYESYREDDVPMSMEEKSLVRKIDFFLMPIVCTISFLQVRFITNQKIAHRIKLIGNHLVLG